MAHRADAADARHQRRHLVKRAPLRQLFKAAKLRNVEVGVLDAAVFIQVQRDLRVAFDARHRIDDDSAALLHEISSIQLSVASDQWPVIMLSGPKPAFQVTAHRSLLIAHRSYAPNLVFKLTSGVRPSSNSLTT